MKNKRINFFRGIKNCFKMIYLYDKKYLFLSICMAIFQGIVFSVSLLVVQKIINNIQLSYTTIDRIIFLLFVYLIVNIFPSILFYFYNFYRVKFSKNFEKHIEILLLEKVSSLKLRDFEDDNIYDMINRAQSQKGRNITILSENLIAIIKEFTSIFSLIFILAKFKFWLVFAIIVIPILKSLYSIKIAKEQYKVSINRTWKERKLWYIDHLLSAGYAYKELILFKAVSNFLNYYKKLKDNIISQDMKIEKKIFCTDVLYVTLDSLVSAVIIGFIIMQGFYRKILIGDSIIYIQAVQSIKENVESIFLLFSSIVQELFYTELLFEFLEYNSKYELEDGINIEKIENIELINLSYRYPNAKHYSLKNINLILEKNNPVAILGRNGSGKTTLLKIILGFYDDYEGKILINGKDLKIIKKSDYINQISCMFQDYVKYEATLKENILLGNVESKYNDKDIIDKLEEIKLKSQIYEEDGLDTILGTWFGKKQLSMGEWQRVAISRTIIKEASMYIFDEPDSSLDSESINELLLLYKKIFINKIGLFITHNIQYIKKITNNIIVLENGIMIEKGGHDDLMLKKGVYYKLFHNCK